MGKKSRFSLSHTDKFHTQRLSVTAWDLSNGVVIKANALTTMWPRFVSFFFNKWSTEFLLLLWGHAIRSCKKILEYRWLHHKLNLMLPAKDRSTTGTLYLHLCCAVHGIFVFHFCYYEQCFKGSSKTVIKKKYTADNKQLGRSNGFIVNKRFTRQF